MMHLCELHRAYTCQDETCKLLAQAGTVLGKEASDDLEGFDDILPRAESVTAVVADAPATLTIKQPPAKLAPVTLVTPPTEIDLEDEFKNVGTSKRKRYVRAPRVAPNRHNIKSAIDPYPSLPDELKKLERFGLYKLEWNEKLARKWTNRLSIRGQDSRATR